MKFHRQGSIKINLVAWVIITLVSTGFIICSTTPAAAKTAKLAIIPFEINSQKDISFIQAGIVEMLKSRLSWKDHVSVIEKKISGKKSNLQVLLKTILNKKLNKGSDLNSGIIPAYDYVLTGSITEFAGAFSLDAKVFNMKDKTYYTFSRQAATMQKIIPEINMLAAKINKKIFNRRTAALEIIENNGNSIENKREKIIRQNPEQLMNQEFEEKRKSDRPFWKFWGKDDSRDGTDRPFWKFWGKDKNNNDDNIQDRENNDDTQAQEEDKKEDKPFWKIW